MNIAAVQAPKQISKSQNAKETKADDFSKILSQANKEVVTSGKKENKTLETKETNEDTEVDDKDKLDIIAGMLSMNLFESTESKISLIDESNVLADNTTLSNVSVDSSIGIDKSMNIGSNSTLVENLNFGQVISEETIENISKTLEDNSLDGSFADKNINFLEKEISTFEKDSPIVKDFKNTEINSKEGELKNIEPKDIPKSDNPNLETFNKEISDRFILNKEANQKIDSVDLKNIQPTELESDKKLTVNENKEINIMDGNQLRNLNKVDQNTTVVPKEAVLSNDNLQNVNDTIIQLMETTSEGDTKVINVKLNPKELGAVDVTLKMEGGKLTAKITVENEFIKGLFDSKVNQLNESLAKQNIQLEKINIDLNLNSNSSSNSGFDLSQNGSFNQGRENSSNRNYFGLNNTEVVNGVIQDNNTTSSGKLSILA